MIEISASAQTYLHGLLAKQDDEGVSIRVFVAQPGTPQAETCIAYCRPGEEQEGDIAVEYEGFRAWFEGRSEPYLEDAEVDYQEDQMGGQLTIKAPNARVPKVGPEARRDEQVVRRHHHVEVHVQAGQDAAPQTQPSRRPGGHALPGARLWKSRGGPAGQVCLMIPNHGLPEA